MFSKGSSNMCALPLPLSPETKPASPYMTAGRRASPSPFSEMEQEFLRLSLDPHGGKLDHSVMRTSSLPEYSGPRSSMGKRVDSPMVKHSGIKVQSVIHSNLREYVPPPAAGDRIPGSVPIHYDQQNNGLLSGSLDRVSTKIEMVSSSKKQNPKSLVGKPPKVAPANPPTKIPHLDGMGFHDVDIDFDDDVPAGFRKAPGTKMMAPPSVKLHQSKAGRSASPVQNPRSGSDKPPKESKGMSWISGMFDAFDGFSSSVSRSLHSSPILSRKNGAKLGARKQSKNSQQNARQVRFFPHVVLGDTWSDVEYDRTPLENPPLTAGDLLKIAKEVTEYKQYEMPVHPQSRHNTTLPLPRLVAARAQSMAAQTQPTPVPAYS